MAGWSSALTIEELDSDRSTLRVLTLLGPAMPFMDAAWGNDTNQATKFYPGNPDEGTQTRLVATLMPSDWEGEWNLTRMNRRPSRYVESEQGGAATTVTAPGFLTDVLEDMHLKGRRLRVTWTTDSDDPQVSRTVVREGRMKTQKFSYRTSVDIKWQITFEWVSRGGTQQRVVATRDQQSAGATSAIQSAMAATLAAVQALIASENDPTQFDLGQLEQLADAPLQLLGGLQTSVEDGLFEFQKVAGIVTQLKNLPFNLSGQVLGLASDTLAAGTVFFDSISRTPAEQAVLSDEVDALVGSWTDLGAAVDSVAGPGGTNDQAQQVQAQMRQTLAAANAQQAAQNAQTTSGTRAGNILALRLARDGDTPQFLSNLYYGTPDHDVDILAANDLPWYQVTFATGQLLVIPQLNPRQQATV